MNGHPRTHGGYGLLLQILDGDGHIVDVNQGWAAALSYPPEDILGRHFCDFIESGHCDTVSAFLHDLEDEGASRFLPIVLRDKTRNPVSALLIAQPLDANGGYACEIWTIDGMTQAMTRARLRTERNHADDILMRTFTAITELLAKSTRISDFLRDLGLLMEAVSGFPRVIIEPPPKTATPNWKILLKDNLQRLHGPSKATGTMILDAARHAEVSADLAAEFGRDDVLALWFSDESMPTARRPHPGQSVAGDRALVRPRHRQCPVLPDHMKTTSGDAQHGACAIGNRSPDPCFQPLQTGGIPVLRGTPGAALWLLVFRHHGGHRPFQAGQRHPRSPGRRPRAGGSGDPNANLDPFHRRGRALGGEEFLIVCAHTKLGGAVILAELLRQRIADHAFPVVGGLSLSFGVSAFEDGASASDVVARADRALYQAKRLGRNRICLQKRDA